MAGPMSRRSWPTQVDSMVFFVLFWHFYYWVFKLCLAFVVVDDDVLLFFFLRNKKRETMKLGG